MKLTIPQLNFLYLYSFSKDKKIPTARYDVMDTEDIKKEMTQALLLRIINKHGVFENVIDLSYGEKIDELISLPKDITLHMLGAELNKKVIEIKLFKDTIRDLLDKVEERNFVENFKEMIYSIKEIKSYLKEIDKKVQEVDTKEDNNDDLLDMFL